MQFLGSLLGVENGSILLGAFFLSRLLIFVRDFLLIIRLHSLNLLDFLLVLLQDFKVLLRKVSQLEFELTHNSLNHQLHT